MMMMRIMMATLLVLLQLVVCTLAFAPLPLQQLHQQQLTKTTTTSLSMSFLPPPLIISGIMKKMREDKEKKKIPISREEASAEAPGLRVGRNAWKWPPIWPYDSSFFLPATEAEEMQNEARRKAMSNAFSGGGLGALANLPTPEELEGQGKEAEEESSSLPKFDALKFWSEEKTEKKLDAEAKAKLTSHYEYYLQDGMSILEFGAGADSYLGNVKPSRHVGVSASMTQMQANPSLTERLVVDLNKVVEDRDVDSDDLRRLAVDPLFDAIIMTNTIPFLTNPREVFRSAWYLLKPGGMMMVAFSSKEATKDLYPGAQTIMWKEYNDDQHMWISGSFFQFSAGEGWQDMIGFDVSPESAKQLDSSEGNNPLANALNRGKANNMFVVQAKKVGQRDTIEEDNVEKSINSLTWMLPVLESRDKNLVVPRLARVYQQTNDERIRQAIQQNVQLLPNLYEVLFKMDQFAFTFGMQSQLAADLISDPDFSANPEQLQALREGLGLRTPGKNFWLPVGQLTAAMQIEDKISLLAYVVPRFGSDNLAQEQALQSFVSGLKPTFAVIRSNCPTMPESDVQLLGTEMLAMEILTVRENGLSRQEFATWLGLLTAPELESMLAKRKSYNEQAKEGLIDYKLVKAENQRKREEYNKKMQEQIAKAQSERSMIFNPKTQKMEVFQNPNKKT